VATLFRDVKLQFAFCFVGEQGNSCPPGKRCVLESEMAKKSLKQLFFQEKPEISVSNEIGEIKIYLPTITNKLDPLYYEFLKHKHGHMYVVCPLHSSCLELKLRIKGIVKLAIERITLFYLGAILENEQVCLMLMKYFFLMAFVSHEIIDHFR
jgi:hypothetical protein